MANFDTAPESVKTQKARSKLKKQIADAEQQVTQQALRRKVNEIKHWLSKYAKNREIIRNDELPPPTKSTEKVASKLERLIKKSQKSS